MYAIEADRTMEEDEEVFNVEVPLDNKIYAWQDKYRPRKPRYFNRVHTGYEWNKYNQSHYVSIEEGKGGKKDSPIFYFFI